MSLSRSFIILFLIEFCGLGSAFAAPNSVNSLERAILEYVAEVSRPLMGPDQVSASVRIDVEEKARVVSTKTKKVIEIRLGSLDVTADYEVPQKRSIASASPAPKPKTFMEKVKSIHLMLTIAPEVNAQNVKVLKKAIQAGWPWEKNPVSLEVAHHPFMEAPEVDGLPKQPGETRVLQPINKIHVAPAVPQETSVAWILLGIGILIAGSILFSGLQIGKINFKAEVVLPEGFQVPRPVTPEKTVVAEVKRASETTVVQDVSRLESEQFDVIDLETTRVSQTTATISRGGENWTELPHELLKIAFQELDAEEKKILIWTRPSEDWNLWIERLTEVDSRLRVQIHLEMDILKQDARKTTAWLGRKTQIEARFVECCLKVANHRPDLKWSGQSEKNAKVS